MKRVIRTITPIIFIVLLFLFFLNNGVFAEDNGGLGPQSTQAIGKKKVLIVVVKFPGAPSSIPIKRVKNRVTSGFNKYVSEQSYGLTTVETDFRGYVMLPDPLTRYKIEPYNC